MTEKEPFDYGEKRPDGQYENHPTIDEGEFVAPVRRKYVHEACGGQTVMGQALAESLARDPFAYGSTFCAPCKDHSHAQRIECNRFYREFHDA